MEWNYDIDHIPEGIPLLLVLMNEEPAVGAIADGEIISAVNAYDHVEAKYLECYCRIPEYGD